MSVLTNSNLLPFRQYSPAEEINMFALDGTGQAGQLVALQTGNQAPENSPGAYTSSAPLGSFTNVANYAYNNPRKVRASTSTDNRFNLLGFTLMTTATQDENGIPLRGQAYNQTIERGFVQTGFTVPVLARGIITLKSAQYNGTPQAGTIAICSQTIAGGVDVLANSPTNVVNQASGMGYVGKFISSSGQAFNGYAQLKVEL